MTLALLGVAGLFLVVAATLVPLGRLHLYPDEATYLSQVVPGRTAAPFALHRARGVSLLLAPIAPFVGDNMALLRGWLLLLAAVSAFVAFRPWVRLVGWVAPVAATVFLAGWVNLLFAAQAYPNFWAAIGIVGVAGHVAAYLAQPRTAHLLAIGGWVAFVALFRPLDSVLGASGIWAMALILGRRKVVPITVALAAGGLLGFAPFFLEAWVRFGLGPVERLFAARQSAAAGLQAPNLLVYLSNLEGPFRCIGGCRGNFSGLSMSWREVAMVLGFTGLAAVGVLSAWRRRVPALAIAAAGAITAASYYLQCQCAVNLRYLQPAYALLAPLVAAGLLVSWQAAAQRSGAILVRAGLVLLVAAWAGHQVTLADDTLGRSMRQRQRVYALARAVDERAAGRPCAVATRQMKPQIEYYSSCVVASLDTSEDAHVQHTISRFNPEPDLAALQREGWQVYALVRSDWLPPGDKFESWKRQQIGTHRRGRYLLLEPPTGLTLTTRYDEHIRPQRFSED